MHSYRDNGIIASALRWGAAVALAMSACGGSQPESTARTVAQPAEDTRSALEKRRDDACEAIAPTLTECARQDAVSNLAAGKVTKADFDRDTAPEILRKNTERFLAECTAWSDISSRQVRVLEVCFKAESQCGPLRDCLANLEPK